MSSTFLDLKEERQAVIASLLECDAFPAGMELFPAADDDAWTLITKVIDECDYYLLVMGGKYGSVDPADDLSYTEKEFDYAVAQKKPVMAFLHGDPQTLMVTKAEVETGKREKLEAFREKVKATKHVKYWTSAEGLAGQVALTYNKFTRLYDAVGWIRADQGASQDVLAELAEARSELDRLRALRASEASEPLEGIDDLSQGSDQFEFPIYARASYNDGTRSRIDWNWVRPAVSWNDVLRAVGPRMFDESDEESIRKGLTDWLWAYKQEELKDMYLAAAQEGAGPVPDSEDPAVRLDTLRVDDEDLGTILTQFKALGLVQKSIRRRSVKDRRTYWTLTPRGEQETVRLRAIRRHAAALEQKDAN